MAVVDGEQVRAGKPGWLAEAGIELSGGEGEIARLQEEGMTVVGVSVAGRLVGLLGIGDTVKEDAAETVHRIRDAGMTPVMMTGDTERTARAVAGEVGIERVLAEVLPGEKREGIGRLQDEGRRVAMVGDGINDAPALMQADIGVAIGAGTDIAIESADIVVLGDRLGGVMDAYEIGRSSYRKTRQNLIAAFGFNSVGVTAATTGLVHPVFAMIAMVLSVTAVLANSVAGQLLTEGSIHTEFAPEADGEAKREVAAGEGWADEKGGRGEATFNVNLHCGGCEQRVKDHLSEHEGVQGVSADAGTDQVDVLFNPDLIDADELREQIVELGYEAEPVSVE